MNSDTIVESVEIPDGCTVTFEDYHVKVKGPKGEAVRRLTTPRIDVKIENKEVVLRSEKPTKREKRMVNTYKAHLKNMMKGITQEHIYKLKICSGHFPMTVTMKNNVLEVKNFLGEKVPRRVVIKPGVKVNVKGDIIEITSVEKELAGNAASSMEKMTRRTKFDKRIFQDGIYITNKDGKSVI